MSDNDIKRDTGRFDRRQWFVDGYAQHWFTTREDAEAAWALAKQVSLNAEREMAIGIREYLEKALP